MPHKIESALVSVRWNRAHQSIGSMVDGPVDTNQRDETRRYDHDRAETHSNGQEGDGHPGPNQIELLLEGKRPQVLESGGQAWREDARARRRVVVGVEEDTEKIDAVSVGIQVSVTQRRRQWPPPRGRGRGSAPDAPGGVEVGRRTLPRRDLFVQEQGGDEEAAEHEEGVERHGGPGYDQQVGNG